MGARGRLIIKSYLDLLNKDNMLWSNWFPTLRKLEMHHRKKCFQQHLLSCKHTSGILTGTYKADFGTD